MITLENADVVNITHVTVLDAVPLPYVVTDDNGSIAPTEEFQAMSTKFLKIKLKSLAAEARIIRAEELKIRNRWRARTLDIPVEIPRDPLREQLYLHRIHVVRKAARETLIAYGYLRGRVYDMIEPRPTKGRRRLVDWKAVEAMVRKYGTSEQVAGFKAWQHAAATEIVFADAPEQLLSA